MQFKKSEDSVGGWTPETLLPSSASGYASAFGNSWCRSRNDDL